MLIIAINVVYAWSDYIGYTISSAKLNAYETLATGDGTLISIFIASTTRRSWSF